MTARKQVKDRATPPDDTPLAPQTSRARVQRLRARLLDWYDKNRRDLPWRRSRDPYAIWISETMLQQTRVETVIPYYNRFLERFPDIESLATANQEDVFGLWTGLGYYSRARNLQRSAQLVMDEHNASMPSDTESLRKLPGIGRYTAGAVASIAFNQPEAVVDGNVVRVLTRLLDIRASMARKDVQERLWDEAGALAKGSRPGDLNQALMELGATVCTPRSPRCKDGCPVRSLCHGLKTGDVETLPNKPKKKKPRVVQAVAAWLPRRDDVLVAQRPESGLLANLWELPGGELSNDVEAKDHVVRVIGEKTGLEVTNPVHAGTVEHVFSHLRLSLHLYRCSSTSGRVQLAGYQAHRFVSHQAVLELPQATLNRKALELFL